MEKVGGGSEAMKGQAGSQNQTFQTPENLPKDLSEGSGGESKADVDQKKVAPKVSFFLLFKYADAYDYLLMVLAFIGAVGDGSSFSIMLSVVGSLINTFGSSTNVSMDEFNKKVIEASAYRNFPSPLCEC